MTIKRTFGWVQNPGDLNKLKRVTGIFLRNSFENNWLLKERLPLLKKYSLISKSDYELFLEELSKENIQIKYRSLKGKGAGGQSRRFALCTGIVQAVIDGQRCRTYTDENGSEITIKKPYTDDWTADGYLRWAISCGLLEYLEASDECRITELGRELVKTVDGSKKEYELLTQILLSYPPVVRILTLLSDGKGYTKFDLGSKLGFKGEMGFTSIPQNIYVYDYCSAESFMEKERVKSNEEGDSDKYARGITSWLSQMKWVEGKETEITEIYNGKEYTANLRTYSITRLGEKALMRARGNSKKAKIPRRVMFEMLASNKAPGSKYLRYARAYILNALAASPKTLSELQKMLKTNGIEVTQDTIRDDIIGLQSIGINIQKDGDKYKLYDKIIGLNIPKKSKLIKETVNELKEKVRSELKNIDHKYLVLIDLAYSDASSKRLKNADAREFEIQTAELLTKELSFNGHRLGDANRPDAIIWYDVNGSIIDNKSYKNGFSVDKKCSDEMSRYINENQKRIPNIPPNEWWKDFDPKVTCFTFLFVTSFLKGEFEKQLEYISATHSGIKGAAISVDNLLFIAEKIKSGDISYSDFFRMFANKEIIA